MKRVFITEFIHDLKGLQYESLKNLEDEGSFFEFVMDVKQLVVGDLIMFNGDFYILKGKSLDKDVDFFKSEFAKTYDSFNPSKKQEWDILSKCLNGGNPIPPYMWMHHIQMFEDMNLCISYKFTEDKFFQELDIPPLGEGIELFDCFEQYISGFKKLSLKEKIQAMKMKIEECSEVKGFF